MQRSTHRFTISLFALVLVASSAARASEIDFSWQSSFSPSVIPLNSLGEGSLNLIPLGGAGKNAGNAQYWVGASDGSSALHGLGGTNQPFTMTLKLTDGPSGLSDVLTFHATVRTYASLGAANTPSGGVFYSFSDGVRSLVIGQDAYHVQLLDGQLAWGVPDPAPDIAARINVTTAPEPSSLLLAGMAVSALCFTWRKNSSILAVPPAGLEPA
jgi:hypothetical protein